MKRTIYHFQVGNGNCSLIESENFIMIVDLCNTEDYESSYDMLKPFLRLNEEGMECIDVLCVTHGDEDHCKGFRKFQEKIDSGDLLIGAIWHQGIDRRINEDVKDLPDDYLALQEEIDKRNNIVSPKYGQYENAIKAGDAPKYSDIFLPNDLEISIYNPTEENINSEEYDLNDLCIVMKINLSRLDGMMFTGDTSSKVWQDSILPSVSRDDEVKAKFLVCSHHGSYNFFGEDRDSVREADPNPENYEALGNINFDYLIISSSSRFPTNGDSSTDAPPHYAAWKWYHRWLVDNRDVNEDDKHPNEFIYCSDGNIKLDFISNNWDMYRKWNPDEERKRREEAKKLRKKHVAGSILIGGAPVIHKRQYGKKY